MIETFTPLPQAGLESTDRNAALMSSNMKSKLNHFTSKMYLVTYEKSTGLGCRDYGIMSVHNKPQSAHAALKKLIKQKEQKESHWQRYEFNLKTVDVNSPFSTSLFQYLY